MINMISTLPAAAGHRNLAGLEFKSVRRYPERMAIVLKVFQQLYKEPNAALKKIEAGEDRTCRLLYQDTTPKAVVVYKDIPSDDYKRYGSGNSIEIKVHRLLDPKRDSGKGLCTELLQHVLSFARSRHASAVHIKLSPSEETLLQFFGRHQFKQIKEEVRGDSHKVEEYVLQRLLAQANATPRAPAPLAATKSGAGPVTRASYKDVTLKNPYVDLIQKGRKTVEGRINAGMFLHVRVGDRFRFFNQAAEVFCRVTDVKRYPSFDEMLTKEGHKQCIPESNSLKEAADIYNRIPGYAERARQSGVLALHLAVEPKPEGGIPTLKRSREEA